jgi:hypothetical protein
MTKLDVYLEAGRVYWLGHTCFNFFLIALWEVDLTELRMGANGWFIFK